uniref:non-specific serine/threonine protein kinase n=1 Tax=Spirogyra varians TaxID=332125 RepID=A0A2D1CSB4_9VIRI|nr:phototropin [Spirogyra varians]
MNSEALPSPGSSATKPMFPLSSKRYSLTVQPEEIRDSAARGPSGSKVLQATDGLKDVLTTFQQTFVMSDATKPDMPIMFASEGFYQMTGYTCQEVIGKNCRFLQGPDTDRAEIARLKQCVLNGQSYCGRLLNYRKDGTPFWNLLTISPVKDDNERVVKYVGMQVEVTKYTEGAQESNKRPNELPVSLIRYDARQKEEAESTVVGLMQDIAAPDSNSHPLIQSMASHPPSSQQGGGMESLMKLPVVNHVKHAKSSRSSISQPAGERRKSVILSMFKMGKEEAEEEPVSNVEIVESEQKDSFEVTGERKVRRGMDLATTLERIQKNFVITDPRLPDNPIIFASDDFLELTEFSREEVLGRNCRFLQGEGTDPNTVEKIREAIRNQEDITVQLLNYTKSGRPFWNLFHLQAVRDSKGALQYFIGVQLDASSYVEPEKKTIPENTVREGTQVVIETAKNVDLAVKGLPDSGKNKVDIWAIHSNSVEAKPHSKDSASWKAIEKLKEKEGKLGLKHFRPIKPLGCGDTGSVHLVELRDTQNLYAMKAMDKEVMINRNKVHRACTEREILEILDHPFLPKLYASFQTSTHVCLITDYCSGGELYLALEQQKGKRFSEEVSRFYAAEVLLALEYLHCQGIIYRDLKPENILLSGDGHAVLTDFDLSFLTTSNPTLVHPPPPKGKEKKKKKGKEGNHPIFVAEPQQSSNSFVGTEEYIAPEIINGVGHSSQVDWWGFGIFLYEMLYGRTPFRGRNRQKTFTNVLTKQLTFPSNPQTSMAAKQLIASLLEREPLHRLGSEKGATEIKSHPFFASINWPLIRNMRVPRMAVPVSGVAVAKEDNRKSVIADIDEDLEWDDPEIQSNTTSFDGPY